MILVWVMPVTEKVIPGGGLSWERKEINMLPTKGPFFFLKARCYANTEKLKQFLTYHQANLNCL